MQLTIVLATLLSVASAAAVPTELLTRRSSVCGPLSSPLCCELDVEGVATLNCANGESPIQYGFGRTLTQDIAGPVTTTAKFQATCAKTGTTAQCCILPLGTDGLVCTAA
jgi:hypothetical protein